VASESVKSRAGKVATVVHPWLHVIFPGRLPVNAFDQCVSVVLWLLSVC